MNDSPFWDTLLNYSLSAHSRDTVFIPPVDKQAVQIQVHNSFLGDSFEHTSTSWSFLLVIVVIGVLFYLLLRFMQQRISRLPLSFKSVDTWGNYLRQFLLLYEFLFLVVIGSLFVLVNPLWNGLIVFFLVFLTFPLCRNYLMGQLLCFDRDFGTGKRICVGTSKGVINHMSRLGIYVNTNNGMQYFNYTQLQKEGFSIMTDSSMEEYCDLNIHIPNDSSINAQQLLYKLMGVPYLDSGYKPILIENDIDSVVKIRVLIRKGNHRRELLQLIEDWGYQCQFSH